MCPLRNPCSHLSLPMQLVWLIAFSGKLDKHWENGIYNCVCCNNALFSSDAKFDSGSGWPSFHSPIEDDNVGTFHKKTLKHMMTNQSFGSPPVVEQPLQCLDIFVSKNLARLFK